MKNETAGVSGGPTSTQCVPTLVAARHVSIDATCASCLCRADAPKTLACGSACWALWDCVAAYCGANGMDITCIQTRCSTELGGQNAVAQAQQVPFGMCSSVCTPLLARDAGTTSFDAGN
jgi:hypothetical protein